MAFIDEIKKRAKQEIKTIVLPEATDARILEAAQIIKKEEYAKVILIGNEEEVRKLANEHAFCLTKNLCQAVALNAKNKRVYK